MKSKPRTRRPSVTLASTAMLVLAGGPHYGHASRRLRSGGSLTVSNDSAAEEEGAYETLYSAGSRMLHDDKGFEVVGQPLTHDPNSRDFWRRSMVEVEMEEEEGEEDAEPKEHVLDESLAFVDPEEAQHERLEKSCKSNEKLWVFQFRTDNYGYETSWKLEKQRKNGTWKTISSGPPPNRNYHDAMRYHGATCLEGGNMYKLIVSDSNNDGICCSYGRGTYEYSVDGFEEFNSNYKSTFTSKGEHTFYVGLPISDNSNNGNGNADTPFSGRTSACGRNKGEIKFKITTDKFGQENSWTLRNLQTNQIIRQRGLNYYGDGSTDEVSVCVNNGRYRFTLTDGAGDGICCKEGEGRYELYLDDELMVYGSDFNSGKEVSHDIVVGYQARYDEMSQRETQYLQCHNWRREKYHVQMGGSYVPVKYDMSLARDAQSWANELLRDCDVPGIEHEPGVLEGENLAKNAGNGNWGQLYPVENICRRWYEREETWGWPDNAHFTQGLWRSARYVGCAESEKAMAGGGTCRIQVCRYARAGNCNMKAHNSIQGDNWKIPMMMDHNPCGPACPPNGCH